MRVPRLALAAGGTVALLVLGLFDPSVSAFFPSLSTAMAVCRCIPFSETIRW